MERIHTDEGVQVAYDERGDGPALLMIMGIGVHRSGWSEALCDTLAASGLRVIRVDVRDVGDALEPETWGIPSALDLARATMLLPVSAAYTLNHLASDALAVLDHLEIERAHVVGASLGGMIAQRMALSWPDRVASMVLMMTSSGSRLRGRPSLREFAGVGTPAPDDVDGFIDYFSSTGRRYHGPSQAPDEAWMMAVARASHGTAPPAPRMARQALAALVDGSRVSALGGLSMPVTVVHGTHDPVFPLRVGRELARDIPGSRLEVLEGIGHALSLDMNPALHDLLVDHVRGTPTYRPTRVTPGDAVAPAR